MKEQNTIILLFSFLLITTFSFAQNERLIIGRTTGKLFINKDLVIRTFGFANSLSGQVTLPGYDIDVKEGDSVKIDFWNISQGNPVSLYCKEIEFTQLNKQKQIMNKKEPVHHMEHGFYSFQAKKSGTYLYYSPENYPFNLQAGMFGVIIIRPKEKDSLADKPSTEILWCSNEIDTKWHTDAIMGTEYDDSNKPILLPDYKPNYFLINGKTLLKNKGLQSFQLKQNAVLLRLVNAGLYVHDILFPLDTKLQIISGNGNHIKVLTTGNNVKLNPGECLELYAFLGNTAQKAKIRYQFINPLSNKIYHQADIPVFY
ncbi:multicopper oxidase [Flavobacterium sp. 90]|uniref:multicopper oxidase domain-containing protein n=1 Tax=unclassified Flavobacterium TaxID=196869 RepID=UPI000F15BDCE|nr:MULTISPECIES: multicopper oxidase domain-containing protein [unclassified Flavobacterium]RKR11678.1 multicopper oxidase [Flavobacterium sp. 81]TCK55456.1 multicopper oxidase [Flavobacterium sp. 90]